jgi:hypothetical protein
MSVPASRARAASRPELNGLGQYVTAVEAARARLGSDLDLLTTEVRAQMGQTLEKTAWKAAGIGSAVVAGVVARKALVVGWKKAKHSDPPTNPASRTTSWGEALIWTVASGIAVGIARLVAQRGAAAGWEKAVGSLPPGLEDVSP